MRRTQLYLDDDLWNALHVSARSRRTTISELVREAVRERYFGARERQMRAMREFVGVRKGRSQQPDAVEYIRTLRRGDRLERLLKSAKDAAKPSQPPKELRKSSGRAPDTLRISRGSLKG